MSRQNTRGGFSGRSPLRPDGYYSHRNRHVGGASKPFSNEDRMLQGRGKHPHHISHGSGSKHFKDKPTSNFVYRPKKTSPDVISNSLEPEGSNMKHPECFEAPDSLYRNYDLLSSSTQSDSKNMHPDVGASKPLAHDCFRTEDRTSQGRGKCSHHTFPGADGSSMKQPECIVASDSKTQLPDVSPNSLEAGVSCMKQPECIVVSDLVTGDVIHSFSGHSDSKNMHLDEIGIQIGETPEKKEEDDATSKLNFSGKLKIGHMQESVPPAIADTKDQVSLEEGPNNFLSIGVSENSVQQAIDKPFDLCPPKKGTVMLNPSLLVTNRQKRNDSKLSIVGQSQTILKPGMVLLKKYLSISDQVKIVKICRDLGLGPGGFYQPGYRDGANLYLKMMCLGKNWDPETSQYGTSRPTDGAVPPIIPAEFHQLVGKAIQDSRALIEKISMGRKDIEAELPCMSPDICIANFYSATGKLGLHQDKDESQESIDKGLPVVSFSIGDSAEFLYGDLRDVANAKKVILESGDVLIFGGKSRRIFHGVEKIVPDTAPKSLLEETSMRCGRLNLTFRQY